MKLPDFARFKKFMELSTSPVDAEALAALRKANELLVREGLTWTRVLDRSISIQVPFETADDADGRPNREDMEDLFSDALANATGTFRSTIESIYEQWLAGRRLSDRQREVVTNAADRARGWRG